MKRVFNNPLKSLFFFLPLLFLSLFYFYPLLEVFTIAVKEWSGKAADANFWLTITRPLGFTLWQAFLSLALTLVVGLPLSFLFGRYRFRGKGLIWGLLMLPFILPTVVVAAGFSSLIGEQGWINLLLMRWLSLAEPPLKILYSLPAILLAHVFYNTTIIVRVVGSFLAQIDTRIEHAARSLGASQMRTLFEITFPLTVPAILSAALLVFLFDFMSFGVILMLGGPRFSTLETEIYVQALYLLDLPTASLLSLIQMACTLLVTLLNGWLNRSVDLGLNLQLHREGEKTFNSWKQKLLIGIFLLLIIVFFVSPLISLLLRSILRVEIFGEQTSFSFTLDYYRELFINRRKTLFYVPPMNALWNSLKYGFFTLTISLVTGFLAVYTIQKRNWISRLMSLAYVLPLGTSPVAIGLGIVIVISNRGLSPQLFPILIPFVHSLVAMPFVIRALQPALRAIPSQLRFAASVLGASPLRVWREVDLPLMWRASSVAALFAFTLSLGEFGATTFLSRPEFPTLPIAIYRYISQPGDLNYGQAMAMSSLLLFVCALCIAWIEIIEKIGRQSI